MYDIIDHKTHIYTIDIVNTAKTVKKREKNFLVYRDNFKVLVFTEKMIHCFSCSEVKVKTKLEIMNYVYKFTSLFSKVQVIKLTNFVSNGSDKNKNNWKIILIFYNLNIEFGLFHANKDMTFFAYAHSNSLNKRNFKILNTCIFTEVYTLPWLH